MDRSICAEYLCLVLPRLRHFLQQTIAAVEDRPGTVKDGAWVVKVHELSKRVQGATCKVEMIMKTAAFLKGDVDWRQRLEEIHHKLVQLLGNLNLEELRKRRKSQKNRLTEEGLVALCDDVVASINLRIAEITALQDLCELARPADPPAADPPAADPPAADPPAADPPAAPPKATSDSVPLPRLLKFWTKIVGAIVGVLAIVAGYFATQDQYAELKGFLWACSVLLGLAGTITAALPELLPRGKRD